MSLRKSRNRPIQKRSFLLVELLLAMGLLMLCLFPMIKTHVGIARAELQQIQEIRHEQEVRRAMYELKKDLHDHVHSWEDLTKNAIKTEKYILNKEDHSTKNTNESGLVLHATLFVGNKEIERRVYVEKALNYPH